MLLSLLFWQVAFGQAPTNEEIPYFEFLRSVDEGLVSTAEIQPDGETLVELTDGTLYETRIPVALTGDSLLSRLEAADIEVVAIDQQTSIGSTLVTWLFMLLPVLLIVGVFVYMGRRATSGLSGAMGMGRSRAKVFDSDRPRPRSPMSPVTSRSRRRSVKSRTSYESPIGIAAPEQSLPGVC